MMFKKKNTNIARTLKSHELGDLYFGQLHIKHQDFFDKLYGQHTRVKLRDLPHYIFWRDEEYKNPQKSQYHNYLKESWNYYYPKHNTAQKRKDKLQDYVALRSDIEKNGVKEPVSIVLGPDGRGIIVSGNHRASIAYHLGLDIPFKVIETEDYIIQTSQNEDEFYGTKRLGVPYQSIFYKDKELIKGRRRDILRRFLKMNIPEDIRGKSILDTGSNIAVNAMLAWHYGAKSVTAAEVSPKIGTSALRLSTLFDARINVATQDLGLLIKKPKQYDTVFCFSLHAHVGDKKNLERNLVASTGKVLYFEGHERSEEGDYEHIFRHYRKVDLIGHNDDGVHSRQSTRPFFRCEK